MKVNKIVIQQVEIEILDVALLSKEEYEKCKEYIPPLDEWWWLRSQGSDDDYAAFVYGYSGRVDSDGIDVNYTYGVRPSLFILKSPFLRIGDTFKLAGYMWTVIDETIALCDSYIGKSCFRKDWKAEDANVYEASDVKRYIEDWAKENNLIY